MKSKEHLAGFSLFETAIVMTVIGLITAGIFAAVTPLIKTARISATNDRMYKVAKVIAAYAQHNNRIPCPADPNLAGTNQMRGAEVGSGTGGATVPNVLSSGACRNGLVAFNEGIVPYTTLGLDMSSARDGWDNFFTYRVSPVFALDPSQNAAANAHFRCRMPGVWTMGDASSITGAESKNAPKARFCCPPASLTASDIVVQDSAGVRLSPPARDTTGANYASAQTPGSYGVYSPALNVTAVAFILVSHGEDGGGAFLPTGTRMAVDSTTGTAELQNANSDVTFVLAPRSDLNGTAHYDDILLWKTQDTLMSMIGRNGCGSP